MTSIYRKPHGYLKVLFRKIQKIRLLETVNLYLRSNEINSDRKALYNNTQVRPRNIFENIRGIDAQIPICVVIHVHYEELLDQIISKLSSISEEFDVYITTTKEIDLNNLQIPNCRNLRVFLVENRGRDILPFLSILQEIPIESYQYFLKLHTKLSPWIRDADTNPMRMDSGSDWRNHFIESLIGERESVKKAIKVFENKPKVGLLTAKGCLLDIGEVYGANKKSVIVLMKRSKIFGLGLKFSFPAGSMYWARASLVRKIAEIPVSYDEFEEEKLQDDGTLAHAIERFVGLIVRKNKMSSREI
jgi:lipopolysaccharide biosynthesis protein